MKIITIPRMTALVFLPGERFVGLMETVGFVIAQKPVPAVAIFVVFPLNVNDITITIPAMT